MLLSLAHPALESYFCSPQEAEDHREQLTLCPRSWPLAIYKASLLVSLARRLRQAGARFTASGGQLRPPPPTKPTPSTTSSSTQGTTAPIPKAAPKEVRGAVASAVYLKLATNEVIAAEALVEPGSDALVETARQVAEYGQRGWALNFSNGHSQSTLAGAGLPANLVHSNASLLKHARRLVVAAIGEARDSGTMHAKVDTLASLLVVGNWDDGQATHRLNPVWTYRPMMRLMVLVLGGKRATDSWAVSLDAVGAGCAGDPDSEDSFSKAVRHLESILVKLHGQGGGSRLNAEGNFGIEAFAEDASSGLDLPRAVELLGRLLSQVHLEMDSLRSELRGTCPGRYFQPPPLAGAQPVFDASPFDLISIVDAVRAVGLPRFAAGQLSADHVKHDLRMAGLTPELLASLVAQARPSRATRWGPNILPPIPAVPQPTGDHPKRAHSPAPPPLQPSPASSRAASPLVRISTDVKLVAALELTADPRACPWWSLFGKCHKSKSDECPRCPTGILATQAQVDAVVLLAEDFQARRVVGVPTDARGAPKPNPAPGTGDASKASASPTKKTKLDTG